MVLGKFLPPHLGHVYLVDFARHYCRDLTVVVSSLRHEPIPGEVRYRWMKELFPDVRVFHLTDENPQFPHEHPQFWDIWERSLRSVAPDGVDFVFASEDYGFPLAERLNARYVPVDHARDLVPVSGEKVRSDPMRYWRYLPVPVRPWFVRRVCIFGPESTGKSTLARRLATHYDTVYVHEYARALLKTQENRIESADYSRIARGQIAAEEALARQARRVLFCDTDLITTTLWAETLHGHCPEWIRSEAQRRHYDLYLLLSPDTPWVDDPQRFHPQQRERQRFFARCEASLRRWSRRYAVISGDWESRFAQAVELVDPLLERMPQPLQRDSLSVAAKDQDQDRRNR